MKTLQQACFGALTFCGASYRDDECGANGLPLTPSSVKILGRFQQLKNFQHPHLCQYIDIHRSKHERVIIVSEFYTESLRSKASQICDNQVLIKQMMYEALCGLSHLNSLGLVHRCLSPCNILVDDQGKVKLFNYGLYFMTGYGSDVTFPLGAMKYLPPETLISEVQRPRISIPAAEDFGDGPGSICPCSPEVDVWSLGMIFLDILMGNTLWKDKSLQELSKSILKLMVNNENPLDIIINEHDTLEITMKVSTEILDFLRLCLTVDPGKRPHPKCLLEMTLFKDFSVSSRCIENEFYMFSPTLRCINLEMPTSETCSDDHLSERKLDEVYCLWQLAGGDLELVLKKAGMLRTKAAVSRVVNFVLETGEIYGEEKDVSLLRDGTVTILPMDQLKQRLSAIEPVCYYPILEDEFQPSSFVSFMANSNDNRTGLSLPASSSSLELAETSRLPLVIKEKDVEYQFHRLVLYERLLTGYPYTKQRLWKEARIDIPPLYRAKTWAAILEVEGDVKGRYDDLDKETPTQTDRQIEVDIPRCHQYNEVLSSPQGHKKLKRILKAWVVSHPEYVYWQGLDSLCAPFLCLNFNDEALAFACMDKFIPKYLHKFFLKDNSAVIQEYLAVFSHLVAFHDPELHNHLNSIGFIPDLYAIPWFLTMFAHVFPMHKIYHLWDTLLLGNSSFPLFIGVAILHQFRDQLLSFCFNDCILHFSDMPEIDIEKCVEDSVRLFCATPKSATYRKHARPVKTTVTSAPQSTHTVHSDQLATEPITLQQLKIEKCCRISSSDLLDLKELLPNGDSSPYKKSKSGKSKVLVIDCRTKEEFQRGAIPDSINIPFESAFLADGQFQPNASINLMNVHRTQVKVIVSNREPQAIKFSENVLQLGYLKVCVLHKGMDSLRNSGVLVVPTPEL